MSEANINFTEGSGKRIHTWDRTISATLIQDQFMLPGEYPYPSYVVAVDAVSIATANDHVLQIMAGSSLNVRIRRIFIKQAGNATAASARNFQVMRLTTAGSGGTAITPAKFDNADSASGAAAQTLPSSKGTESTILFEARMLMRQAIAATGAQADETWEWFQKPNQKPLLIPAGTSNGIAIKSPVATAGASLTVIVEFVETNYV